MVYDIKARCAPFYISIASDIINQNRNALESTLKNLYDKHPEIQHKESYIKISNTYNSINSRVMFGTIFYTRIHNKDNMYQKVNAEWKCKHYMANDNNAISIDEQIVFQENIICLENNWYLIDENMSIYDIAEKYGHHGVMVEILKNELNQSNELINELNKMIIEKNETINYHATEIDKYKSTDYDYQSLYLKYSASIVLNIALLFPWKFVFKGLKGIFIPLFH